MAGSKGASSGAPKLRVINLRLVVEDDMSTNAVIEGMDGFEYVWGVAELESDGFGHLIPRPPHVFVTEVDRVERLIQRGRDA